MHDTIDKINSEIAKLMNERSLLLKKEEESKYEEHFNTIITEGGVDTKKLLAYLNFDYLPKELYYTIGWRECPKNYVDRFVYDGFRIDHDGTDDGNYVHYWYITKEDNSQFTIEELIKLIPDHKELIKDHIIRTEEKLENLKKYQKKLEKITNNVK
jgi:hypothetical protein